MSLGTSQRPSLYYSSILLFYDDIVVPFKTTVGRLCYFSQLRRSDRRSSKHPDLHHCSERCSCPEQESSQCLTMISMRKLRLCCARIAPDELTEMSEAKESLRKISCWSVVCENTGSWSTTSMLVEERKTENDANNANWHSFHWYLWLKNRSLFDLASVFLFRSSLREWNVAIKKKKIRQPSHEEKEDKEQRGMCFYGRWEEE